MRERELKLVVDDAFVVPDLDDAVDGATLGGPVEVPTEDLYLDTVDLRLARWGCTFRHRPATGWTVKLPRSSAGSMLDREEVTLRGAADAPPARLTTLVSSLTRRAELVEVARLDIQRTLRSWRTDDGTEVALLTDDRVRGVRADGTEVTFREIEVELAPAADGHLLDEVGDRLQDARGSAGRPVPKAIRVLGQDAVAPPDVVTPGLGKRPSAREVIRAAVAESVAELVTQLPVARHGLDATGVGRAGAAARRLRADVTTFAPLLDESWCDETLGELTRLVEAFDAVRDDEALVRQVVDVAARHPEVDSEAVAAVLAELEHQRRRDRSRLLRGLRDRRTAALLDDLVAAAAEPPARKRAKKPATDVLPKLVRKRWRRLDRAVDRLAADPTPEELDGVRVLAAAVADGAEAVAPAVGKPARRFVKHATRIEWALDDGAVPHERLLAIVDRLDAPAGFAAGQLAQQLRTDALPDDGRWRAAHAAMRERADWLG